jgi:ketosteroid isomerase-like protein
MTNRSVPFTSSRREMLVASAALFATGIGGLGQVHAQGTTEMPLPRRPEDVTPYISSAITAGDLDAAMKVYVADAVFVTKPGTTVRGHEAIRASLSEFMQLKLPIKATDKQVLVSGDVMEGNGPDGKPLKLSGTSSDVVRRQADGVWRFVIDNPFGTI